MKVGHDLYRFLEAIPMLALAGLFFAVGFLVCFTLVLTGHVSKPRGVTRIIRPGDE